MSNKDIRILLNTPSKEEGEEQLDELLPLAVGALKLGYKGVKGGLKAGVGALKLGANALTAAPAIAAKAVRKGVEAGASGDVRKLGTKVGFRRRGGTVRGISRGIGRDIRKLGNKLDRGRRRDNKRRGEEVEAIAQSVADKLGKAQTQSGSQTNKPQTNKPEPKKPPQGAQTAEEFNKENELKPKTKPKEQQRKPQTAEEYADQMGTY